VWYHRVVPLLQEYFYHDGERLRAVLGEKFVQPVKVGTDAVKALGELYDSGAPKHEVVGLRGDPFVSALQELAAAKAPEQV